MLQKYPIEYLAMCLTSCWCWLSIPDPCPQVPLVHGAWPAHLQRRRQAVSIVRPSRMIKIFVFGDSFTLNVQGDGTGLMINKKRQKLGGNISSLLACLRS